MKQTNNVHRPGFIVRWAAGEWWWWWGWWPWPDDDDGCCCLSSFSFHALFLTRLCGLCGSAWRLDERWNCGGWSDWGVLKATGPGRREGSEVKGSGREMGSGEVEVKTSARSARSSEPPAAPPTAPRPSRPLSSAHTQNTHAQCESAIEKRKTNKNKHTTTTKQNKKNMHRREEETNSFIEQVEHGRVGQSGALVCRRLQDQAPAVAVSQFFILICCWQGFSLR
jgi:hypothetical protein